MTVATKSVAGRRQLKFNSLNDIVTDAERLVASPGTKMLGNWPLDRLLSHLTVAINGSLDGVKVKAPWYIRLVGPFIKKRILTHGMSAGFNLAKGQEEKFFPVTASQQDALDKLRHAVNRTATERMTTAHPVFGPLSHEEWEALHLRHAEMHLSFALPG